jgi:glucose/arabinose dehydrogenase
VVVAALMTLAVGAAGSTPRDEPVDPRAVGLRLEPVAEGLDRPVFVTAGPDGRLYILEQHGTIRVVKDGVLREGPFLDIRSRILCCAEEGLLGLAFHPGFRDAGSPGRGLFYVAYTDRFDRHYVLAEFRVRPGRGRADPTSERRLMDLEKPFPYHYAGMLAFGPDGYLWVAMGDGGHPIGPTAPGDPLDLAQSLDTRFGKLLRIDPLDPDGPGRRRYAIPPDNPFVGLPGRDEIWAYGFRNPWRFSFDRLTGDLWVGDVGHSLREEIDRLRADRGLAKGGNFGWRLLEGTRCYEPATDCDPEGTTILPRWEYPHPYGAPEFDCAVSAGYVVRDPADTLLAGRFVFGDYCSGRIWSLPARGAGDAVLHRNTRALVVSFGEGPNGELYLCDLRGTVFRVVPVLRTPPA